MLPANVAVTRIGGGFPPQLPGPSENTLVPFPIPDDEPNNHEMAQEDLWDELERPVLSEIERKEQLGGRLPLYMSSETESDHLDLEMRF
jgi:hypothetical protein